MHPKFMPTMLGFILFLVAASAGVYGYQNRAALFGPAAPAEIIVDTATTTPAVPPDDRPKPSSPFRIRVGETARAGGFSLTLTKITEDSRCPANVNCIWAGRVAAEFAAVSGTQRQTIVLTTDSAVAFGGYDFKIEEVSPAKSANSAIRPADYMLTVSFISND